MIDHILLRVARMLLQDMPPGDWTVVATLRDHVAMGHVLHGSPVRVGEIAPSRQVDHFGRPVHGIFATQDPVWPLFYATVARESAGSIRCLCVPGRGGTRYGFSTAREPQLHNGYVYALPSDGFVPTKGTAELILRTSARLVPIAEIAVEPHDFPFAARLFRHDPGEPVWRTWWRRHSPGRAALAHDAELPDVTSDSSDTA